jgi:hypothetical protein
MFGAKDLYNTDASFQQSIYQVGTTYRGGLVGKNGYGPVFKQGQVQVHLRGARENGGGWSHNGL